MTIIETDRLVLRQMTPGDIELLLAIFSDAETMKFYPQPFDRDRTEVWIQWNLKNYSQYGFGLWALILKETQELIGDCGLVMQEVKGIGEVEIGYHIRRDCWGKGFATEAAIACRDYGFDRLGYSRLISLIHPDNFASRRVAEKTNLKFIEQIQWRDKPTCIYAIEKKQYTTICSALQPCPRL